MNNQVLIVGGGGFIGTNLSIYLSNINLKIVVLNHANRNTNHLKNKYNFIDVLNIDINKFSEEQFNNYSFDTIIWLLHSSVPATDNSLRNDIECDLFPLINFVEKIIKTHKVKKFIYLSSGGTVYGNIVEQIPLKESCPTYPISKYGLSKLMAENVLNYFFKDSGIDLYIVRPSNVYGPFQNVNRPQGIIAHAFNSIVKNKVLNLYDDGKIVRDYIHVNDLSNLILKIIQTPSALKCVTMNAGSGIAFTISNIVNAVSQASNLVIETNLCEPRKFDCNYNVLDISFAKEILDWDPIIDLSNGISEFWEWFKSNLNE